MPGRWPLPALLDRPTHHLSILEIDGEGFRLNRVRARKGAHRADYSSLAHLRAARAGMAGERLSTFLRLAVPWPAMPVRY